MASEPQRVMWEPVPAIAQTGDDRRRCPAMHTEQEGVSPTIDDYGVGISAALFWVLFGSLAGVCLIVVVLALG
jgi:hypothetical protein